MQKYQNTLVDLNGNVIAGAQVEVQTSSGAAASLYSSNGSGLLPSNYVVSDSQGVFYFYAENGRYNLLLTANQFTAEAYSDILLFDPVDAGIVSPLTYGAVGDGVTDDTAAIQAAFTQVGASGGGTVTFPAGVFVISSGLTVYKNLNIQGAGREATIIKTQQYGPGASFTGPVENYMLYGSDCDYLTIRDLSLYGPGIDAARGGGIYISVPPGNNRHMSFENLLMKDFAANGIYIKTPILTSFKNVRISSCVSSGVYLDGGTSTCFDNCMMTSCLVAGIRMVAHTYSYVIAGGSENNSYAYKLEGSNNITFIATGCEGMKYRSSAAQSGVCFHFSNGRNNTIIGSLRQPVFRRSDSRPFG
jgi:hypothetical protein